MYYVVKGLSVTAFKSRGDACRSIVGDVAGNPVTYFHNLKMNGVEVVTESGALRMCTDQWALDAGMAERFAQALDDYHAAKNLKRTIHKQEHQAAERADLNGNC